MICARHGNIQPYEKHPCFNCGEDIVVGKAEHCKECDTLICPECGYCMCKLDAVQRKTLEFLQNTYCKDIEKLKNLSLIVLEPWMDLKVWRYYSASIFRCSMRAFCVDCQSSFYKSQVMTEDWE